MAERKASVGGASSAEGKQPIMIAAKERGPGPAAYGAPSTLGGTQRRDSRRRSEPSFTFGSSEH